MTGPAVRRSAGAALEGLLGSNRVSTGTGVGAWSLAGVEPEVVVFPESEEEVAAVLRRAGEESWRLIPAGAGRRLRGWRPEGAGRGEDGPAETGWIVLSTVRLAGIEEYEPADLTVTAGAGTTLEAARERTAAEGQRLPLDLPAAGGETLGGVVATDARGPLAASMGRPRDHLLGVRLVTGDGRVLALGGRVVKNVAGYDLTRLVAGSGGSLGVVTQVTFRLFPEPETEAALLFEEDPEAGESRERLVEVARAAREARPLPASVEVTLGSPAAGDAVIVSYQGSEVEVETGITAAAAMVERVEGAAPARVVRGGEAGDLRTGLRRGEADAATWVDLSSRPSDLRRLVEEAAAVVDGAGRVDEGGGARGGGAHGSADPSAATPPRPTAWVSCDALDGFARVMLPSGASPVSGLAASPPTPRVEALVEGIRVVFDPHGILPSPGHGAWGGGGVR